MVITRDLPSLECQIYELKKDIDIRQFSDNEFTIKKKLKEFFNLNWKEKINFITSFKSFKVKKFSYSEVLFELDRKFILLQGKMYIFLIQSLNKKVEAFTGKKILCDGVYIITKNNRALINGFKGKAISDFTVNS